MLGKWLEEAPVARTGSCNDYIVADHHLHGVSVHDWQWFPLRSSTTPLIFKLSATRDGSQPDGKFNPDTSHCVSFLVRT